MRQVEQILTPAGQSRGDGRGRCVHCVTRKEEKIQAASVGQDNRRQRKRQASEGDMELNKGFAVR